FELALGYWGGLDSYDIAALSLLSHGPSLYLLHAFYNISASTVALSLSIDALSAFLPFRLLRPLARKENDIVADVQPGALRLLRHLPPARPGAAFQRHPKHRDSLCTTPITLLPLALGLGVAAKSFVFTPAAAADIYVDRRFDASKASLRETLMWNFWGYDGRTKMILARTAALVLVTGGNTFVQTWGTVEGVETLGAGVYAGVWALAAGLVGAALGVVGAV
ncbi:hypothetical protein LSUE1_G009281, partial [Lachnellula suecica]